MSDEYISREEAINAVFEAIADGRAVFPALNNLPAADVRPVVRGKWVQENIVLTSYPPLYKWHCSECGEIKRGFDSGVLTNYCPNCGADMREGQT